MAIYRAPLRDMRFVLYELHRGDTLSQLPGLEEMVLFPLNRLGDEEGCVFENGAVRTPRGFCDAYRTFREGGWTAIAGDPKYGGQGLPHAVTTLVDEMVCSSTVSFALYPAEERRWRPHFDLHPDGRE